MQPPCKPARVHHDSGAQPQAFTSPLDMSGVVCLQLELHTIPRLDQGGSTDSETLPHEVWSWTLGANTGYRPPSRQAHPAAERANTAVDRTAIAGRYGKLPAIFLLDPPARICHCTGFCCLQLTQACRLILTVSELTMHRALVLSASQGSSYGLAVSEHLTDLCC